MARWMSSTLKNVQGWGANVWVGHAVDNLDGEDQMSAFQIVVWFTGFILIGVQIAKVIKDGTLTGRSVFVHKLLFHKYRLSSLMGIDLIRLELL